MCDFAQLEAALEKRKGQVLALKAQIIAEPDNEALKAELAKSKQQGEAVASKMKAIALQENRLLKSLFCQIDADASGTINAAELQEALKASSDLSSLKPSVLVAAVANAPGGELSYDGWKVAIKSAGGPTWQRMLFAGVGGDGKLKGILTLDELFQQKKAQCKAIKARVAAEGTSDGEKETLAADLKVTSLSD